MSSIWRKNYGYDKTKDSVFWYACKHVINAGFISANIRYHKEHDPPLSHAMDDFDLISTLLNISLVGNYNLIDVN